MQSYLKLILVWCFLKCNYQFTFTMIHFLLLGDYILDCLGMILFLMLHIKQRCNPKVVGSQSQSVVNNSTTFKVALETRTSPSLQSFISFFLCETLGDFKKKRNMKALPSFLANTSPTE